MKVVKVLEPNKIGFFDEKVPEVGPKEVLVKVKYCGICGTDFDIYTGNSNLVKNGLIKYPIRIGHEWSGIIDKIGNDVKSLKPGDRVVGDTVVSCGECKGCKDKNYLFCENLRCVGTIDCWDGAYGEYMLMPERHIYKIPDNVALDEAALIEPAGISLHGIHRANFSMGQTVLVLGTGAIGLTAVALAKASGASKIIIGGRKESKLEVAKKMGADLAVNTVKENLTDIVMAQTQGKGIDLILEASGSDKLFKEVLGVIKQSGKISLLGFYEDLIDGLDFEKIVMNNTEVLGISGSPGMYQPLIDMLASKKIDLKPLITHRYPFDKAIEALNAMKEKNETRIKIMLEF